MPASVYEDRSSEPVCEAARLPAFLLFSFVDDADSLLHIKIEDSPEANLSPFLRHLCHFLGKGQSPTRKPLVCAQGPEGLWYLVHASASDCDCQH